MKHILIAAVVLVLSLTGCVSTMSEEDQRKHSTVFVTMKVIEESSLSANDVLDIVETLRTPTDTQVDPGALRASILDELGYSDLSPSDKYLVSLWVDSLLEGVEVGPGTDAGRLPVELEQWLEWVEQAAYLSGAER